MRILAQKAVSANVLTVGFTVPAGPPVNIGYVQIGNRAGSDVTAEVTIAPGGAADTVDQHVTGPVSVPDGSSPQIPLWCTLFPGDIVRVKASGVSTFTIYGD